MFGISTTEFLLILAVGLIVFGPQKLPELARALGKAIGEFRKATSEIKQTFEADENIAKVKETFDKAVAEGMRSNKIEDTDSDAVTGGPDIEDSAMLDHKDKTEDNIDSTQSKVKIKTDTDNSDTEAKEEKA
jgi:TatA/E family protein of Tat protein translocase